MAKKTNQTAKAKKQSIDKKPATKAAPKTVTPPPAKDAEVIDYVQLMVKYLHGNGE